MLNLFKIEWLKIKTYRTFWILFIGFLVSYPLAFYFFASKFIETTSASQQGKMVGAFVGTPFEFPRIWQSASWLGGLFFILIGMLYILLITNEVQYRTHRQNIIDGWSRMDFLMAKFSLLLFFVITSTVLVFITALLTGLIFSSSTTFMFDQVYFVGYFALMALLYLMLAFLVSILIKRTGLSIIIYFGIVCILDNVLWGVLTVKGSQLGYFMPLEAVDSLVPNPFKPRAFEQRKVEDYALIIAALAYISIYGYIIISYFKKADLKT
ncbi:MAG: ABC transporter permease [Sphingobacteriales bacterium]|nr:MAG: ABC transporter permease [Sphingobacteriales bacterium]